ncbi:SLC13 family permease [Amphiplicatus metriothermophilus]|uniref:Solute carrier family 13 (Sodium-dependent dicarboxylate transporter), member 2/3/5 n=1 Tax=Amphiplicatus metriothermophilus TaxID=1519374 RepID=A0A239PKR1_9PROT|nr:SLC13 family permease [Amphiplicatus metriothermophilus]MBB5517263.1 sodium-dependent dicarboxylate transporter 2/3/5 [Amphiplicatus metriothermophilus]SNT68401.1 solute carrier family 13 (sodium-dependent dicarboxylate transporter), member 2/3/5 [Amphiplicatus metriothermophilus]
MKWGRLLAGLIFAALVWLGVHAAGQPEKIVWTAAITALTAFWWVTEALPIPATSLVPFALFPMAGVLDQSEAASALGSYVILLLMASFMLSKALERSGAHERLALYMIRIVGFSGRRVVFGFMIASALLSMWISNTATTLMLSTLALAILARTDDARLAAPLLLGIAYAASLGGTGTLIGTPPNLIFADAYLKATGEEFLFARWMGIGIPVVALGVPAMALWLTRSMGGVKAPALREPGPWRKEEVRTLIVFAVAILAWITRSAPFGGWAGLFGIEAAGDSTVATLAVVAMFLVPNGRGGALLDWKSASDIPWGMLLLFAGGICIAAAFRASGLDAVIGEGLQGLSGAPVFFMILGLCLSVTFLTEITSNTATANLLMPLLAAVAAGTGLAPELLMIPAAISASCAFMLPVATAPNAIVYATGRVPIARMAREGVALNFIVALVVASVCWTMLGR